MANARCFLSREEDSHKALDALVDQIEVLSSNRMALECWSRLSTIALKPRSSEHPRNLSQLQTLTGTVSDASIVNGEAFFGEPMLGLLRWEPRPQTRPTALQLSRLGDHNLDNSIEAALILSSSATAGALLASASKHDIFTMGAVSFAAEPTLQFHRDGSIIAGATGLGWQDSSAIATTLIPSAEPLGESYEITAAHEDVVIELNGRPAVDVLSETLNLPSKSAFDAIGTDYLIGIERNAHDYSQQIHRHITALDPVQKMFSIGYPVEHGDRLVIGSRNRDSATRLLQEQVRQLRERISDRKVDAIIFNGCIARPRVESKRRGGSYRGGISGIPVPRLRQWRLAHELQVTQLALQSSLASRGNGELRLNSAEPLQSLKSGNSQNFAFRIVDDVESPSSPNVSPINALGSAISR